MDIPSSLQDWQLLNAKVEAYLQVPNTHIIKNIIWFVAISGPIAGLLYLLSAWKRCRSNGCWIVRIDEEGYLYPHTHVLIPIWAFAFTGVNLAHSISLLIDLGSHLHERSIVFNLLTYPTLACFGWTKIWSLLYAMPPSKYRLTQVNQNIGSPSPQSTNRCLSAILFNLFIIVGYLLCFFGSLPWIILAIKETFEISSSWHQYRNLYLQVIKSFSNQTPRPAIALQTLLYLRKMANSGKKLRKHLMNIFITLLVTTATQVIALCWTSYRILAALYCQVMILRQAGKRLKHIRVHLDRNDFVWSHASEVNSNLKIASTPKAAFTSKSSISDHITPHMKFSIRNYLPTFKRGTGVSAALWKSGPFRKTQQQIMDTGVEQMMFYYRQLRSYAMNTFWQTFLAAAVMLSYFLLNSLLVTPAFQDLSVMELEVTVFEWVNITWNCGTGLILGIISCIVAFSPAPEVPREPRRRTESFERMR